jgi:predicted N-acetyltransferase YhbS
VPEIREITPSDVPAVTALARALQEESPRFRTLPFDPEMVQNLLGAMMKSRDYLTLIAEDEKEIVGVMVAAAVPYFFTSRRMTSDIMFYVKPSQRGSRVGLRLLREYEAWARTKDAHEICIGLGTEINLERNGAFLLHCGYKLNQLGYTKQGTT